MHKYVPILPKPASVVAVQSVSIKSNSPKLPKYKRKYKCANCNREFSSYAPLQRHLKEFCAYNTSNNEASICDYCCTLYADATALAEHAATKHNENKEQRKFLCILCQRAYKARGYLIKHITEAHNSSELQYSCALCVNADAVDGPLRLHTRSELLAHYDEQHRQQQHELPASDTLSMTSDADISSVEMLEEFLDLSNLTYTSNYDEMDFNLSEMFEIPKMAFKCPKCTSCGGYQRASLLLHHIKTVHTKATSQLICVFCAKVCSSELNLKRHTERMHKLIFTHICYFCERKFSTMDHLKKHVQSAHLNAKPFVCDICGANFGQCGHLKQHRRIHTKAANNLPTTNGSDVSEGTAPK